MKEQNARIVICISGRGSNMDAIIRYIKNNAVAIDVCVVVSSDESAQGLKLAQQYGVPTEVCCRRKGEISLNDYGQELVAIFDRVHTDLIVLAGFMQVLPKNVIEAYRGRIVNIHPSLLPLFPGLKPHAQALEAGVKVSGCTVHFVDEKVDGGQIIAQVEVPVEVGDTEETLAARILEQEHLIYPQAIAKLALKIQTI